MFFFFSSRRRHTRFSRDWSSDVCSSDLTPRGAGAEVGGAIEKLKSSSRTADFGASASWGASRSLVRCSAESRSEERRVGKECGAGGVRGDEKRHRVIA